MWLGLPGDGDAGSTFYQLELSNTSGRTCTVYGFPGVSAIGRGGGQLGSAASRDYADLSRLVTLRRGATAHVLLRIVDVANFPAASCDPGTAVGLRVYPPNDSGRCRCRSRSGPAGRAGRCTSTCGPR